MAGVETGNFDAPDEKRTPDKTELSLVNLGGVAAGRLIAQPGWKWSDCIKPVVGTESCEAHHIGYAQSGHMHVVHNDGTEADIEAGDAYVIEPGHDAWVVGDEPFVALEFDSKTAKDYAAGS